ncbi:MAG: MerR family transcriptional regulator [Alkalispirochaetaceae bacterium]
MEHVGAEPFYIGVASRKSGVHPSTIRLYESLSWIPAPERTAKGYRLFTEELVARLQLTARCLKVTALGPTIRKPAMALLSLNGAGAVASLVTTAEELIGAVQEELRLAREAVGVLSHYRERLCANEDPVMVGSDLPGGPTESKRLLKVSEAARLCGVTADQIRNWERNGLLTIPRDSRSGYRLFGSEDLERLLLTRLAVRSRFSLSAIRRVMRALDEALLGDASKGNGETLLERMIDTPTEDELAFFEPFPTDRWISTLNDALDQASVAREIAMVIQSFPPVHGCGQ